jgi:hypothetical protein
LRGAGGVPLREGIGSAIARTRNIAADSGHKINLKLQINVFSLIQIKEKIQKENIVKLHVEDMRKCDKKGNERC